MVRKRLKSSISPNSVRSRCVIEVLVAFFMLSRCFLDFSVVVGAFVIGLSQISSFLSINRMILLWICGQKMQYRFKKMLKKEHLTRSSTVIWCITNDGQRCHEFLLSGFILVQCFRLRPYIRPNNHREAHMPYAWPFYSFVQMLQKALHFNLYGDWG